jgi:hypothetical protein
MQEFNEAVASVVRRKKGVDGVVVDRVEDHASWFPEGIALEKDVGNSPG